MSGDPPRHGYGYGYGYGHGPLQQTDPGAAAVTVVLCSTSKRCKAPLRSPRLRAEDSGRRADPQLFQLLGLAPSPLRQVLKLGPVQSVVTVRDRGQRQLASFLALHPQPQPLQLDEVAQR